MKRHLVLVALSVAALLPGTMWAASLGDDASNRLKTSATGSVGWPAAATLKSRIWSRGFKSGSGIPSDT